MRTPDRRPAPELTEPEDLFAYCRERMAGFKVPKRIVVVDSLPKNASGKVLKRDPRASFG